MKIAVIGAGAIGSLAAGYLKSAGEDVCLAGHADSVKAIKENGLKISGVRGELKVNIGITETLVAEPELVILATKTQDLEEALARNFNFIQDSVVLATQNGVQAENIISALLPEKNIISSIVMFGATYLEPGKVVHNFEGSWVLGNLFSATINKSAVPVSMILNKAFPTLLSDNIKGMKYLKIFINANNCIPAILGVNMQEAFSDPQISRISIAIWKEAFEVTSKLEIKLVSLPGFPIERITKLIAMPPEEAAKIFSSTMAKLSKDPLYGSVLQSIMRGKVSEIDYINGEFVNLAQRYGLKAELNKRLVELVHEVEKNGRFLSKDELLNITRGLIE
ncbi:MAG: 2-dehydropantoate 2-reductase [Candidatus Omnitrophota bacterium]|jgi:2-dehydropantoate 2-reductase